MNFPKINKFFNNDAFKVKNKSVFIHKGKSFYNLPLHCPGSKTLMLAGSRPMILMFNSQVLPQKHVKFGEWAIKIVPAGQKGKWLHDFDDISAFYNSGNVRYSASDSLLNGISVNLDFTPMVSAEGLLIRVGVNINKNTGKKIKIIWIWGGMNSNSDVYCPWDPGQKGHILPVADDCRFNNIQIGNGRFYLFKKDIPDVFVCGKATWAGKYLVADAVPGVKNYPMVSHVSEISSTDNKTFSGNIAIVWGEKTYVDMSIGRISENSEDEYINSLKYSEKISNSIRTQTPDKMLNAGIGYINYSADACWRPPSFLHSSSTWNSWYTGWRSLYGPTVCGWKERVSSALKFQSMHTTSPAKCPRNDKITRLENGYTDPQKKATGRIHMSVDPLTGEAAGHHDCDQLFVDFVYHYLCWTGDTKLVAKLWPALAQAVNFQKVTRDSDNDGLYVNILNNWMSDSHEYHQGACTIQSAYLWKNNMAMAEMAEILGKDPAKYRMEAEKIQKSMMQTLWLNKQGVFAEYRDVAGIIHPVPEAPSIYFPIEFGLTDNFQSCRMLKYMYENFRKKNGLIYPSLYFPSICYQSPIVSETLNMSLAAYLAGEKELGWKLLSSCFRTYDTGILHNNFYAPFNPQAGCIDGCIDMLDTATLFQRAVVEGLFGISPQMHNKILTVTPNFPAHWNNASIETRDFGYHFKRESNFIFLQLRAPSSIRKVLHMPLRDELVSTVYVNKKKFDFKYLPGIGHYYLAVNIPSGNNKEEIIVKYRRKPIKSSYKQISLSKPLFKVKSKGGKIKKLIDPMGCVSSGKINKSGVLQGKLNNFADIQIFFLELQADNRSFFEPVFEIKAGKTFNGNISHKKLNFPAGKILKGLKKRSVLLPIDTYCNGKISDIFDSVPPEMVYGFRLHKTNPAVDTSHIKKKIHNGIFDSDIGLQFRVPCGENDAVYITSKKQDKLFIQGYLLKDAKKFYARRYPDSLRIYVGMEGLESAYLLFSGVTSVMQSYVPAVKILLVYATGENDKTILSNPDSFDFFLEHTSYHFPQIFTKVKEKWLPCEFVNHVRQQHADIAKIKVDPERKLEYIDISVLALDTTIGIAGLTFIRERQE